MAQSGILRGLIASGPRALVLRLKNDFLDTKRIDDRRWVIYGNNGAVVALPTDVRQKFPGPAAEAVIAIAGVGEKGALVVREIQTKHSGDYGRS
ncbi:hypothetical protein OCU04_001920 [Sclerotinia nivalis]|uniref:Uncharacterized protein n=1 Tax=Sclerotinia nivalis TaxID=352851 RepID=A0A9X0DRF7_9HELO|nr:hypothetical protein OCU04_001920 [Sclerotinia nivalis]